MLAPICVKCGIDFELSEAGVFLVEMADSDPYKVYFADLFKCKSCGTEVISGTAKNPIAEYGEDHFQVLLYSLGQEDRKAIYYYPGK